MSGHVPLRHLPLLLLLSTPHARACAPPSASWSRNSRSSARLASKGFDRAAPSSVRADAAPRDIVVLCHTIPAAVAQGAFKLDNLPFGRVDLLARCASSAVFLSHGVRSNTRLWLQLLEYDVALCLDGGAVRGMHPDERTLAAAMRRTLAVAHGAKPRADTNNGWSLHRGGLEARLSELLQQGAPDGGADSAVARRPLFQLHEQADATLDQLLRADAEEAHAGGDGEAGGGDGDGGGGGDGDGGGSGGGDAPGVVLVMGDQLGYGDEDEAAIARLGGRRAACSPRGLLTSHCIVLCHHALDEAEARGPILLEPPRRQTI
tara:strand:- start:1290 stop:2246 length:957 start_codon:yes stop_codon:yes gene_type:complete